MRDLDVDTDGMRVAAESSAEIAGELLAVAPIGVPAGMRASDVGVAAVDAASAALRVRQASRITGQAGDVATAGRRYDDTDGGNADVIAVTM